MLFKLDRSILNYLHSQARNAEYDGGLEELARAHRRGFHLIYADPDVLRSLQDHNTISEGARAVFRHLYNKYPQSGGFPNFLTHYIEVNDNQNIIQCKTINNIEVIEVPLGFLSNIDITSEVIFLAEDLSDIDFYDHILKSFMYSSAIRGFKIAHFNLGGYGHNISPQYIQIQENRRHLCFAIADSDIAYPDGEIGVTAKALLKSRDKENNFCFVEILKCREIENLIPIQFYEKIKHCSRERIKAYDQLLLVHNHNSRFYLDLKNGMFVKEIISSQNENYKDYWRQILNKFGFRNRCLEDEKCYLPLDEKCEQCKIIQGFGNPLREINIALNQMTSQKISEAIDDLLEPEWNRIAILMLSWFLAKPFMPAL